MENGVAHWGSNVYLCDGHPIIVQGKLCYEKDMEFEGDDPVFVCELLIHVPAQLRANDCFMPLHINMADGIYQLVSEGQLFMVQSDHVVIHVDEDELHNQANEPSDTVKLQT